MTKSIYTRQQARADKRAILGVLRSLGRGDHGPADRIIEMDRRALLTTIAGAALAPALPSFPAAVVPTLRPPTAKVPSRRSAEWPLKSTVPAGTAPVLKDPLPTFMAARLAIQRDSRCSISCSIQSSTRLASVSAVSLPGCRRVMAVATPWA